MLSFDASEPDFPGPNWGRRHDDRWMEQWIRSTEELARLQHTHRMVDAVIDEIDGRDIRIGDQWLTDFTCSSYLGLDLDEEIIDSIPEYLARWGTHPGGVRMLGSPVLYEQIETKLSELLHAEATLALPTVTHTNMSVLPALAAGGTLFLDRRAHRTMYDGCAVAQARGATVERFGHDDLDELETLLGASWRRPGVICISGTNCMTGNVSDLGAYAALARHHGALLYVDDAHGFGLIGERSPLETCVYGVRGNGIVRHLGESYDNVILVGGFSHAYSAQLAFVACPEPVKRVLKTAAAPYLYSGPSPVASLATVLEGLRVNDLRGDELRARVSHLTRRVLDRVDELGIETHNRSGLPIIGLPLADPADVGDVGETLYANGIYATMAVYPLVPHDEVGFRFQLTAANTDDQVDHLSNVLGQVAERFKQPGASAD
jgi:8-amino-7-oxononanoate synthase